MAPKSDDSTVDAVRESATHVADSIDTLTMQRFKAWKRAHSTTVRRAYVQDACTLLACALAWFVAGGTSAVVDGAIVLVACFALATTVYRTMQVF